MVGKGRPQIGKTRKVSLTMSEETWRRLEKEIDEKMGTAIRKIIEEHFKRIDKKY